MFFLTQTKRTLNAKVTSLLMLLATINLTRVNADSTRCFESPDAVGLGHDNTLTVRRGMHRLFAALQSNCSVFTNPDADDCARNITNEYIVKAPPFGLDACTLTWHKYNLEGEVNPLDSCLKATIDKYCDTSWSWYETGITSALVVLSLLLLRVIFRACHACAKPQQNAEGVASDVAGDVNSYVALEEQPGSQGEENEGKQPSMTFTGR
jgi:hypothetical protein